MVSVKRRASGIAYFASLVVGWRSRFVPARGAGAPLARRALLAWGLGLASLAAGSFPRPLCGGEGAAVRDTSFSHDRGFYEEPFELTISSATPGAEIRYTTDGRLPSATRGTLYTGPIPITTTTVVRAIGYLEGFQPTNIDTQTYIFLADVIHQPRRPPGFPSRWGELEADYEMDQEVVEDPRYNKAILEAFLAIPSMSIVMRPEDLFGAEGVYHNGASEENGEWERPASVEFIYPEGRSGFQVDCGSATAAGPRGYCCCWRGSFCACRCAARPSLLDPASFCWMGGPS